MPHTHTHTYTHTQNVNKGIVGSKKHFSTGSASCICVVYDSITFQPRVIQRVVQSSARAVPCVHEYVYPCAVVRARRAHTWLSQQTRPIVTFRLRITRLRISKLNYGNNFICISITHIIGGITIVPYHMYDTQITRIRHTYSRYSCQRI